eukprot:COSAG01_NODE_803_length_13459_cov_9.995808_5_plen_64_part_00
MTCRCEHKGARLIKGVTSHLVTDMCMYSRTIVGVSPHDYGRTVLWHIHIIMFHARRVRYIVLL